jgi:hypothetical protein
MVPAADHHVQAPAADAGGPVGAAPADSAEPVADDSPAGVRLGFADGSDLHLDPNDPHSLALKAIADLLVHGDSRGHHAGR